MFRWKMLEFPCLEEVYFHEFYCLSELHTIFPHIKHRKLVFNLKYLFRIIQSNFDTNHMGLASSEEDDFHFQPIRE